METNSFLEETDMFLKQNLGLLEKIKQINKLLAEIRQILTENFGLLIEVSELWLA